MSLFSTILAGMAAVLKYAPYALAGAQAVEQAIGAGHGADKKAIVIAAILAGAHAGESVPVAQVQVIAGVVETIVGVLNATGIFGKTNGPVAAVNVPATTFIE